MRSFGRGIFGRLKTARVMRRRLFRWGAPALLVIVVGAASQLLLARVHATEERDGEWIEAVAQPVQHRLTLQGQLLPERAVDIVAAAEGTLVSLDVSWGDKVVAGQRLARINSTELATQLRETEAAALRARIEEETQRMPERSSEYRAALRRERETAHNAEVVASRAADTQTLYDKGIVARMELDQARQEADAAKGQAEEAREDLASLRRKWGVDQLKALSLETVARATRLEDLRRRERLSQLNAPIDGVVLYPSAQEGRDGSSSRELKLGAQVSAGQVLMTIGATDTYLVRGRINEFDVRWLHAGLPATVRLTTLPEVSLRAAVVRVASQAKIPGGANGIDPSAPAEFEVQIQLPAPEQALPANVLPSLRIGIGADVSIESQDAERQIVLPLSALQWSPTSEPVVRVRVGRQFEMRAVTIARAEADSIVIRSGIAPGEDVWVPSGQRKEAPASARRWIDGLLDQDNHQ